MVEPWTRERRRQHTRDLLLDAAEQVFAKRGFEGAALEEIAGTAGYTRGAIYKHFGGKEELFLAMSHRLNERVLQGFLDEAGDLDAPVRELDLAVIAQRWHALQHQDPEQYALGAEFNLYVLRNPEIRPRVEAQRRSLAELVAAFIDEHAKRLGATWRIPSITVARIFMAAGEGLHLASYLDGDDAEDLYEPFLELVLSAWQPADDPSTPDD